MDNVISITLVQSINVNFLNHIRCSCHRGMMANSLVVLYACEKWSLTLREKCRLRKQDPEANILAQEG